MSQELQLEKALGVVRRAALDASEADAGALGHIKNMVLLAAFACEARRTLQEIDGVLVRETEACQTIKDGVVAVNNWTCFEDVVGDVLQQVARQIGDLSTGITDRAFDVGNKMGGAS